MPILPPHHPIGASTGYMRWSKGDWRAQIAEACALSTEAVELSARSEKLLAPLRDYLAADPELPFRYVSIHGPSKHRRLPEEHLVATLCELARRVDGIVMHPDTLERPERYRPLGGKLMLENLDARKAWGRTASELQETFARLPEAGFCLDVAHAWSLEPDMSVAAELLEELGDRLRQVHVSSLSPELNHEPLTSLQAARFRPVLERCGDVPWILEAPLPSEAAVTSGTGEL
jgi:hypothetical protein